MWVHRTCFGMSRFQGGSRLHARLRVLKAVASCGDGNPPPRQRVRSKRGFSSEIQDFAVFGCLSSLDPSICSPHEDGAFRTRDISALPCNLAPPLYAGHSVHFLSVARAAADNVESRQLADRLYGRAPHSIVAGAWGGRVRGAAPTRAVQD